MLSMALEFIRLGYLINGQKNKIQQTADRVDTSSLDVFMEVTLSIIRYQQ